jgi:predicted  nucleic acid-binding Zn-ribbon protein|tara:strand:+ start:2355 stop:2603 length:249 start_codon:yes stop_codon:yes gene_type:complete
MDKSKIISITDIIENKVRKQKELEDYNIRLEDLKRKKFWLEKEIQMAEFIIAAVQSEISPQAFVQELINYELGETDEPDNAR